MATILNRNQTDLYFSQLTFTNESKTNGDTIGDWFRSIWSYGVLTTTQYNSFVTNFNSWNDDADNSTIGLMGTDPSGNHFGISSSPTRPRPVNK